ncbi:MAG: hypothetical protein EXQ56_11400 [Acidobacteria bacterium]|nr:hypothetical protein [Acidobacteriota bacterium]
MSDPSPTRQFLRHALATLAYRAAKAVRNAPADFATRKFGPATRTPAEVLAHMSDVMDWGASMARGTPAWKEGPAQEWEPACARFFASVKAFDDVLAGDAPIGYSLEKLFQGPVADALSHTGQLTMMRGLAEASVKGESYNLADIEIGRVGRDQAPSRREF